MPQLEEALFDYLTNDSGVSALVEDRVVPMRGEEGIKLPYISWHRVSSNRIYTFDAFEDTDAWTAARVQFNCFARTMLEAINVGEALLAALSGYEGDMSGQLIGSSFALDEIDNYETGTKMFRRILDFQISYEDDLAPTS